MDANDYDDELLVDPTQPMRDQSIQSLMLMSEKFPHIVDYKYPLDVSSPESIARIRNDLGPAAVLPDGPDDDPNGYYYYLHIIDRFKNRCPILLPEGEVRAAMFALAVRENPVWAVNVAFQHWLLP
jgi:hypothetical protein